MATFPVRSTMPVLSRPAQVVGSPEARVMQELWGGIDTCQVRPSRPGKLVSHRLSPGTWRTERKAADLTQVMDWRVGRKRRCVRSRSGSVLPRSDEAIAECSRPSTSSIGKRASSPALKRVLNATGSCVRNSLQAGLHLCVPASEQAKARSQTYASRRN